MFEGGASGAARACVAKACVAKACAWTRVVGMHVDIYTYVCVIDQVEWRKTEQLTKRRNWTSAGKSSGGARACVREQGCAWPSAFATIAGRGPYPRRSAI